MWSLFFKNRKINLNANQGEDAVLSFNGSETTKAVVFCFSGTKYGPNVRKEIEFLGLSILMYYEDATPEIITAAIKQLHPVDNLKVGFVVVHHKSLGKEIKNFKNECKGKKVTFVSVNHSL